MQSLPQNSILKFHSETLDYVRKENNLDEREINKSVEILEEWILKQCHFTKKDFSKGYLERTLITTKGSVERAKERLDKVCTARSLMPQFFDDFNVNSDFKELDGIVTHAVLPKLTDDHCRVFITKNVGQNFESTFCLNYFRLELMLAEYIRANDYANGYIVIFDYTDVNLFELGPKMNLLEMKQAVTMVMEGYGMRIKGIHILSSSKFVEMMVSVLKQVFSVKIGSRIHAHKSLETLHQFVPKHILPVEYEGEERALKKLHNEWHEILSSSEFRNHYRDIIKARTDESLRQTEVLSNNGSSGIPGTFRSLSVD